MKILNTLWGVWLIAAGAGAAAAWGAPIEVIANGVNYDSLDAYKSAKPSSHETQAPGTAKTLTLGPAAISGHTAGQWQRLGYEHGVRKVIVDFHQDWNSPLPKFHITPQELEDRLKALLDGRKAPVMVVSASHKLRVMELNHPTSGKSVSAQ